MNSILIKNSGSQVGLKLEKDHEGDVGFDVIATSEPRVIGNEYNPMSSLYTSPDLFSDIQYIEYSTGIFIDQSYANVYALLMPRSSCSNKNLVLANSVGLIDTSFRGEILVRFKYIAQPFDLKNVNNKFFIQIDYKKIYHRNDKICQLVFMKNGKRIDFEFTEELSSSSRGRNGFGSTNKKKGFPSEYPQAGKEVIDLD